MIIALTGGHLTPALALIDQLKSDPRLKFVFFGRRYAQEHQRISSVTFISLTTGKIPRHLSVNFIPALVKIPFGFIQALVYLLRYRPNLVISFGGYPAVPVALAAYLINIPILTHEQATRVGLANQIIGRLAQKVAVSWPQNQTSFPGHKTVLTGNPIRPAIINRHTQSPLKIKPNLPLIYVTGGHQGSRVINQTLLSILPQLLKRYLVIHQTGAKQTTQFSNFKQALKPPLKSRYHPQVWLTDLQVSWCLYHASLVVSRSGANTVTELAFTGAPALLVPLLKSQHQEQFHNAQLLHQAGTALILPQLQLTPQTLLKNITFMLTHQSQFRSHAAQAKQLIDPQATAKLAQLVYEVLNIHPLH